MTTMEQGAWSQTSEVGRQIHLSFAPLALLAKRISVFFVLFAFFVVKPVWSFLDKNG